MLQQMRSASKIIFILMAISFVIGFLLLDSSGLLNSAAVTTSTVVAEVNGEEILYTQFEQAVNNAVEQERQRRGRSLNGDEVEQVRDRVFDDMVNNILLEQEYRRRGIAATPQEIRDYALYAPPEAIMQSEDLQTDGRFDPEKYQRYLLSPASRGPLRLYLEDYARNEVRRQKLFGQIATGAYITDARLWQAWKDQHDSAQVTYVTLGPDRVTDDKVTVSDAELKQYYDEHEKELERTGRAVVSVLTLPRVLTAADTQASRDKALQLRQEILGGASFEDVARGESSDTVSGRQGGSLGRGPRGRFVPEFENAAYALKVGELSQPVKTSFGFHIIRVDERKGDTLALRHILVPIEQRNEAASLLGRSADTLARIAANKATPAAFDSAAQRLGLKPARVTVVEGQAAMLNGVYVPDASAWAFRGVAVGETSDLVDDESGYYVFRLDSLQRGGVPEFDEVKDQLRAVVLQRKKLDAVMADAQAIAQAAASGSLEAAAQSKGLTAQKSPFFSRSSFVPGLGRFNEAIGAAFGLPVGTASAPIRTEDAVIVLRVDQRREASRAAFDAQKTAQRESLLEFVRRKRVQDFVTQLRESADIEDNRREIDAAVRRQSA